MAVNDVYRPSVDYTLATQVTSPVSGKTAFIPSYAAYPATVTDYSITNMTGASQTVVAAGAGKNTVFLQALAGNAGVIWINLAGGTAVVGSGLPLAAGATVTLPGVSNAITGIAASANDDLTVYAG